MLYGDNDLASRDAGGNLKPLANDQFDIDGMTIGGFFDDIVLEDFDPGEDKWSTQDQDNPFGNDTIFGSDYQHAPEWTFKAYTNAASIGGALNALEDLKQTWWKPGLKASPGAFQILRYNIGGTTRRVYGRGRRVAYSHNHRAYGGTAPIDLTFSLMSPHYYDDEQRSQTLNITPNTTGGLRAPLEAPLTAVAMGEGKNGGISEVGGTAPTPFHLYITGPITRPWVSVDDEYDSSGILVRPGWIIQLDTTLVEGQTAHISTYPGALAVTDNRGAHIPLSPSSRLAKARLLPGPASVKFGGSDTTGNAKATIVWRPAHISL